MLKKKDLFKVGPAGRTNPCVRVAVGCAYCTESRLLWVGRALRYGGCLTNHLRGLDLVCGKHGLCVMYRGGGRSKRVVPACDARFRVEDIPVVGPTARHTINKYSLITRSQLRGTQLPSDLSTPTRLL